MENTLKKESTLELILTAALRIFSRFGYRKTNVEDIANEMGMTKGNLYFYVKNKKDLYERAIAHALTAWQRDIRQAMEKETDHVTKLLILFHQGNRHVQENTELQTVLMNDPEILTLSREEDRFREINDETQNMIRNVLEDGKKKGVFRGMNTDHVTSLLFNASIVFLINAYVKREDEPMDQIIVEGLNILLYGILKNR